jgi:hypothetical protein
MNEQQEHWLVRQSTIRRLWVGFGVLLAGTIAAQLAIDGDASTGADTWPGFAAGFGFLACVGLVIVARLLGRLVKRDESYYGDDDSDGGDS